MNVDASKILMTMSGSIVFSTYESLKAGAFASLCDGLRPCLAGILCF